MEFVKFPEFPPEIRDQIWKEAVCEEAEDRLVFVHKDTLRVFPTKNNTSPLLSVNVEARQVALKHYNVRLPIFHLPPVKYEPPLSFVDWIVKTADIHWGRGLSSGGGCCSNRERYWHYYAMSEFADEAKHLIEDTSEDEELPSGFIFLNESTDRFMLSPDISFPHKVENVLAWDGDEAAYEHVQENPTPDLVAYQPILDHQTNFLSSKSYERCEIQRQHMSPRLPLEVRLNIRNVVFCDVTDDPPKGDSSDDSRAAYSTVLARAWARNPTETDVVRLWQSMDFPPVEDALNHSEPKMMYLEVNASDSAALIDEVEENTARSLVIYELDDGGL
ncbi:hypothetical protein PG997_002096 [Apiospora hydei]|uniref:2EXR domain-containing protein n=1 Tax=Apiospora hydei TaxID=1337664 RepID=A0ABR1X8F4_9PEZI